MINPRSSAAAGTSAQSPRSDASSSSQSEQLPFAAVLPHHTASMLLDHRSPTVYSPPLHLSSPPGAADLASFLALQQQMALRQMPMASNPSLLSALHQLSQPSTLSAVDGFMGPSARLAAVIAQHLAAAHKPNPPPPAHAHAAASAFNPFSQPIHSSLPDTSAIVQHSFSTPVLSSSTLALSTAAAAAAPVAEALLRCPPWDRPWSSPAQFSQSAPVNPFVSVPAARKLPQLTTSALQDSASLALLGQLGSANSALATLLSCAAPATQHPHPHPPREDLDLLNAPDDVYKDRIECGTTLDTARYIDLMTSPVEFEAAELLKVAPALRNVPEQDLRAEATKRLRFRSTRAMEAASQYFGRNIQVFVASNDPLHRLLFKAADVAAKFTCSSNMLAMYLSRRKHKDDCGIVQASSFAEKRVPSKHLKIGGYFLTLRACEDFKTYMETKVPRKGEDAEGDQAISAEDSEEAEHSSDKESPPTEPLQPHAARRLNVSDSSNTTESSDSAKNPRSGSNESSSQAGSSRGSSDSPVSDESPGGGGATVRPRARHAGGSLPAAGPKPAKSSDASDSSGSSSQSRSPAHGHGHGKRKATLTDTGSPDSAASSDEPSISSDDGPSGALLPPAGKFSEARASSGSANSNSSGDGPGSASSSSERSSASPERATKKEGAHPSKKVKTGPTASLAAPEPQSTTRPRSRAHGTRRGPHARTAEDEVDAELRQYARVHHSSSRASATDSSGARPSSSRSTRSPSEEAPSVGSSSSRCSRCGRESSAEVGSSQPSGGRLCDCGLASTADMAVPMEEVASN